MARKLIVEVIADAANYFRTLEKSAKATAVFTAETEKAGLTSRTAAQAQVAASVRGTEALRAQAAALREVAAAAKVGSAEQVAAARLAERAESRLAGSYGATAAEASRAGRSARLMEREVAHASRGALAGSGLMHGFGRSIAFASAGFIAFEGAANFIRGSVDATREAVVAQRALTAQMDVSGESFAQNREEIEKVATGYAKFGFDNDEVIKSLTILDRATGSVTKALSLQAGVADIARARGTTLGQAALVVAKVFGGQETALRRAVPGLAKHAHGAELIAQAYAKMRGQAAANTTAAEQFSAALHDTEEILGQALLPTLNQFLMGLTTWLQRMNETGKTQKFVDQVSRALAAAFKVLHGAMKALDAVFGSTKNAVEVLIGTLVVLKGMELVSSVLTLGKAIRTVGFVSAVSAGEVGVLRVALASLMGPFALAVLAGVAAIQKLRGAIQDAKDAEKEANEANARVGTDRAAELTYYAQKLKALKAQGVERNKAKAQARALTAQEFGIPEAAAGPTLADPSKTTDAMKQAVAKGPSAELRNRWFDAMIGRRLDRVQDIASVRGQIDALKATAKLIDQRIAATKDITRKLTLEDQALQVQRQIEAARKQQAADLQQRTLDTAQLAVDRTSLSSSLGDDLAALNAQQAILRKLIAAHKNDLGLQSQLLSNQQAIAGKHQEQKQAALDARQAQLDAQQANLDQLAFNVDAAKGLGSRLVALRASEAQLKALLATQKGNLDLRRQLLGVQQQEADVEKQMADERKQRRSARQFRELGLGPTGEDIVPGVKNLKRQLAGVEKAISGTFLDTRKNKSILAKLSTALNDSLDGMGADVRSKVGSILADFWNQLNKGNKGDVMKFQRESTQQLVKRLGWNLTPQQTAQLRTAIAVRGPRGEAPTPGAQGALAGAGVVIQGDLHLHGVQDVPGMENQLHKRAKGRPATRRGAR